MPTNMSQTWKLCSRIFALIASGLLTACAHTYVDSDGNRNVIGFVNIKLPANAFPSSEWLRVQTMGLTLTRSDVGSAIALGYSDNTLAFVRNNSCVQLNALPISILSSIGESHAPTVPPR